MSGAPFDLSATLTGAWVEYLKSTRQGGRTPRDYVWASGSRDCWRQMALDLMHPEDGPEWTPDQLERFQRGNEREHSVIARLHQIGPRCSPPFQVIGGQERFEIRDRDGTLLIVGKIDGRMEFRWNVPANVSPGWDLEDGSPRELPPPTTRRWAPIFEVKSGQSYAYIETVEDLDNSPWTRRAADQLLAYAYAKGEPDVLLVVDRPRMPLFLTLHLEDHLAKVERFLQGARAAVEARRGGPLPPFTENTAVCRRCDHFGKTCAPPVDYGTGLQVVTDERLIQAAETIAKHGDTAKDVARAEKELKEALRKVPQAICGPLLITGKPQAKTTTELPEELKAKYTKTDPEGAWKVSFQPHGVTD